MKRSTHLMFHYANRGWDADNRTSMNDARIALCIESGVALEDIDPTTGHDWSRRAYDNVRASWVSIVKYHGLTDGYLQTGLRQAFAVWAERRPAFAEGDDWEAAAVDAHRAYWEGEVGRLCSASGCVVCYPLSAEDVAILAVLAAGDALTSVQHFAKGQEVTDELTGTPGIVAEDDGGATVNVSWEPNEHGGYVSDHPRHLVALT